MTSPVLTVYYILCYIIASHALIITLRWLQCLSVAASPSSLPCTTVWESRWSQLPLHTSDLVTVRLWQVKLQMQRVDLKRLINRGPLLFSNEILWTLWQLMFHIQSSTTTNGGTFLPQLSFVAVSCQSKPTGGWMDEILCILFFLALRAYHCMSVYLSVHAPACQLFQIAHSTCTFELYGKRGTNVTP